MLLKPTAKANPRMETRGEDKSAISPALIGMSLRQDIPGGLPSGRARFRFSCHDHSGTKGPRCQQKSSDLRTVPTSRVSKLDTPHNSRPCTRLGYGASRPDQRFVPDRRRLKRPPTEGGSQRCRSPHPRGVLRLNSCSPLAVCQKLRPSSASTRRDSGLRTKRYQTANCGECKFGSM
jgi:hypothetical protein